ncbi:hypothetical protein BDK51DRAFT_28283 [Blyttiomyces helicus]|uniref:Uncharacterized protein n=1 Tax=Blyttiomyces helicus TaxID=388810 RepID=A0A4P9WDB8_9FUNG|nr:hypothetical protein BDK51DRAFT_28283 [Blyttiomyces helicus]|eukprot:RKO90342.1 hypothetical protein BDK51DRAFT_28283 [Blyttiomyces helicus]
MATRGLREARGLQPDDFDKYVTIEMMIVAELLDLLLMMELVVSTIVAASLDFPVTIEQVYYSYIAKIGDRDMMLQIAFVAKMTLVIWLLADARKGSPMGMRVRLPLQ